MTDWKILFVEEDLRDFVEEILNQKYTVDKCILNPFKDIDDWPYMLRMNPHHAVFKLKNGKLAKVTFWCKFNKFFGDPHEYPVQIDTERIIVVIE